jgi:hypothetical protein
MNWLKKGPELKLSELKVPDFLYDLFYDLKERHLLPLVAVLIVAMIGAPIYFKSSTKSDPPAATAPGTTATASSATADGETLVVARSEPGLRDYRRRLKKYRALDPFAQRGAEATAVPTEAAAGEGPTTTVAPAQATVVGEETASVAEASLEPIPYQPGSPETGSTESGTTGSDGGKTRTRYASDSIDVRIVTVPPHSAEEKRAKRAKPQAQVRHDLPELTMLPARKIPAATFIGLSNDGKKALFVVSSDVVSLFGEAKCVIGSQTCQLLALEPGLPETFVYGPQERTYRIELLKINKTYSAKPRRATLGATEGKHGSPGGSGGAGTGPTGSEPAERGSNG